MTVRLTTLENGLRVISDEIPGIETITVGAWVGVGSRHEHKQNNGVSHFLEHMAFKGTERRSAADIAQAIENVGGYLNAYTSRENTAYHARILKNDLPLAMDILSDILQNSTFEHHEFERERTVILQEIGQSLDTPDDIIFDYFQQQAFPGQAVGRPILGTHETVRHLTKEQVRGYMESHYATTRMVIAAAGGVNHEELVSLAKAQFTSIPETSALIAEPMVYQGGELRQERDLEQVHLALGFESVSYGHPDYYAASVLATVLGGGMSSRLFQEIREKRGLVYSIYAYAAPYTDGGVFGMYAGTSNHHVEQLIPTVCEELKKTTHSLTEAEIQRSKIQLMAGLMMGLESTSARCEQLAQHMLLYGRWVSPKEILDCIQAVTKDQVMALAQRIFSSPLTMAALGPIDTVPSNATIKSYLS